MLTFYQQLIDEKVHIHYETKNDSFIRMAIVLKRMGIKNHTFFLALRQRDLIHVDPHDPNLSLEVKLKILVECKTNPWYYFREVMRIPASGIEAVPFMLHRANLAAIWTYLNDIDFGLVQPRQSGKAKVHGTPVKVPNGWVNVENLKVGDTVTAWDGTPSKVIGVYPQRMRQAYRVTFLDGRWVDVDGEHLWTIIKPANRGGYTTATVNTLEILRRIQQDAGKGDFMSTFIPMNQSEQTPDVELPMHPYLLGVLLGDGCFTKPGNISIFTDTEILERIETMLPEGVALTIRPHTNEFSSHATVRKTVRTRDVNPLWIELEKLGLAGCNAFTKFIPEIYLNASHNQRMELIRGLMDTDGYAGNRGQMVNGKRQKLNSHTEYATSSERLANDFQLLMRSIGAQCKVTSRTPYFTYKGERRPGSTSYRTYIRYPYMSQLFWLHRKKEHMQDVNRNVENWKLRVVSVTPLFEKEECTCIAIDHPDKLYITKDYIVTHNTFVTQSIVNHYMYIYADNVDVGMITKDSVLLQDNVKRLKEIRDALPDYVVTRSNKDWDRKEGISYAYKNNYYKTFTAPIDERSAYNTGRGSKFSMLHYDEIAYLRYNQIIVSTTANAMLAAAEQTRKAGLPAISIYTTTAGNPDTKEGAFALSLLKNGLDFTESFYDLKDRSELLEIMKKSANSRLMYIEYSYKQLGKTDEWFKEACAKSNSSQDDINRDLLNIWQAATDKAIIEQKYITRIRNSKIDPVFVDISDGFLVRWYVPRITVGSAEFKTRPLVMGMDTSENVGRDYTTFVILDPRDMKPVATCRCNESNTLVVAEHVTKLLTQYTGITFIPERNNTGIAIIDYVLIKLQKLSINPYTRIFNMVVHERREPKYKDVNIHNYTDIHGTLRSTFGYRTMGGASSSTARNMLYKSTLIKAVEMNADRMYDNVLINEMCSLTSRGGRVDHPNGGHDDTVIAYLLACYLIYFGNNLDIYGIPSSVILESIAEDGTKIDPAMKTEQHQIRKRISELEYLIATNPGHILSMSYNRELRRLQGLVDEKILAIQPHAVAQVVHHEKVLRNQDGRTPQQQIQTFTDRFVRASQW